MGDGTRIVPTTYVTDDHWDGDGFGGFGLRGGIAARAGVVAADGDEESDGRGRREERAAEPGAAESTKRGEPAADCIAAGEGTKQPLCAG